MRILAVDDDPIILKILSDVIELAGYQYLTLTSSGKDALELIARSQAPYDCLLLDIQMPEMDGIQLCEEVRAIDGYEETPIIMVTAMSDKRYIDAAFVAGATDYVTKPFDVLELGTRIKISELLIQQRKIAAVKSEQVNRLQNELNSKYREDLSHPIHIDDIDGLIQFDSFERKLCGFSEGHLIASTVFAIKVAQINQIYFDLLPSQFNSFIQKVAEIIFDNLPTTESTLSYRGNGIFVCVIRAKNRDLEQSLHRSVREIELPSYEEKQLAVRFFIGTSIQRTISRPHPLVMIAEAIESAEKKELGHNHKLDIK